MKNKTLRRIRRQKVLLPLALAALAAGYTALGGWIGRAPGQATAALRDLAGDRSALDDFPLGLTLQSDFAAQDIAIQDGEATFQTRYTRESDRYIAADSIVYNSTTLLSPAEGARTTVSPGFLPSVTFERSQPEGYITSTDRAEIYLNVSIPGHVSASEPYRPIGTLCFPSGMFLESTEQNIAIGWFTEERAVGPTTLEPGAGSETHTETYGAAIGPHRFDENAGPGSFYVQVRSAACAGSVFFLPETETLLDSERSQTISLTGTRSLYRALEADKEAVPENSTPDAIQTCGKAEAVLSFPAEGSSLLALESIGNDAVFLGMRVGAELQFYLIEPDGSIRDRCSLPITDEMQRQIDSSADKGVLQWETSQSFRNTDTDGVACRTLAVTAFREYVDENIYAIGSEDPVITHAILGTEYITFRMGEGLECVSRLSSETSAGNPGLMAWRDGKLLVLEVEYSSFPSPPAAFPGVNHPYYPSITRPLLTVYGKDGPLYQGELLTDVNEQYFWVSYERRFRTARLLDDDETRQIW